MRSSFFLLLIWCVGVTTTALGQPGDEEQALPPVDSLSFTLEESLFSCRFPQAPSHSSDELTTEYGVIYQDAFMCSGANQAWMLAVTEYPEAYLGEQTAGEMLQTGMDESLQTLNIPKPTEWRDQEVQGFPGRFFTGTSGDNYVHFLLISVDRKLYQLTVLRLHEWPHDTASEAFFSAFELSNLSESLPVRGLDLEPEAPRGPYHSEGGRYQIAFPDDPQKESRAVTTDVGELTMNVASLEDANGVGYLVSYTDYPTALIEVSDKRELLEEGKNEAVRNLKLDSIERVEEINLGFDPGIDFMGFGNNYFVQYRVYIVGNRLYQLAVMKEGEYSSAEQTESFFGSFELMR